MSNSNNSGCGLRNFIYVILAVATAIIGHNIHGSIFWSIMDFFFMPIAWIKWLICQEVNLTIIKESFAFFMQLYEESKEPSLTTLSFSGTFDEIVASLKGEFDYYSENYTNLRVDNDYSFDDNSCGGSYYRHTLYGDKLETDEEEELRLNQEEENKKYREEYDRRQYEALKAKFEKS